MPNLNIEVRWLLFLVGIGFIALAVLDHREMLGPSSVLAIAAFPYCWLFGVALVLMAYYSGESGEQESVGDGLDSTPGLGEKKGSSANSSWFNSDDGGSGGGGE